MSSSGCAQNKEEDQTRKTKADSTQSEIVDGSLESPFEVIEKPTLILPDSLRINGATGHVIVKVYSDTADIIKKEIEILVLKNNRGDRVVEYIKGSGSNESEDLEPSKKTASYLKWVNSRLQELKVEKKKEAQNAKLATQIMLRINSDE